MQADFVFYVFAMVAPSSFRVRYNLSTWCGNISVQTHGDSCSLRLREGYRAVQVAHFEGSPSLWGLGCLRGWDHGVLIPLNKM